MERKFMKKFFIIITIAILCLSGCAQEIYDNENSNLEETQSTHVPTSSDIIKAEEYDIGDEIELGGIKFNIYKKDDGKNELFLLAQSNIATTSFSDSERSYNNYNDYEGSLVEGYINRFVDGLEDKGYNIKASGMMDKDDLYDLGFANSVTVSGRPYVCENVPDFVKYEDSYWLSGYYKVDKYVWVYSYEKIYTEKCDSEHGVRPAIVIDASEVNKEPVIIDENLTIMEVVASNQAWTSEGGIENPYDLFYFDCENMIFRNEFKSSDLSRSSEYKMILVNEKTIQVDGVRFGSEYPAEITIVNKDKLRIRFLDDEYNEGDYFLNKKVKE